MELTQEELDAKIKEAKEVGKKEGESAKASELQGEMERAKREAEERVKKIESDAQRKVSEQGDELGKLRKTVEESEAVVKERDELRSRLEGIDKEKQAAEEKKRKEAEKKAAEPGETLKDMTDEEAKEVDQYLARDDVPQEVRDALEKEETAEQTLAAILQAVRDAKPPEKKKDDAGAATKWLQGHKRTDVNDPSTIRQTVRDALKKHDRPNRTPGLPPTGGGPNGKPNDGDVKPFAGFRQSMEGAGTK